MTKLMTWEDSLLVPDIYPYIFSLESSDNAIFCFGCSHANDPVDGQFDAMQKCLESFEPDVVLIEGVSPLLRSRSLESRITMLDQIARRDPKELIRSWGEPGFLACLAHRKNISVYSPEPDPNDEVLHLLKLGFSRNELFLHYLLRDIDQYHRFPPGKDFDLYFSGSIKSFISQSNWKEFDYSLDNLQRIAETIWSTRVNFFDKTFVDQKVWPVKWETVINEIARQCSDYRDYHILDEIKYYLDANQRVFIAYGYSHTIRQEPVIRSWKCWAK